MKTIVLLGTLILPLLAHSVSRVGGGKISSVQSGFEMSVPSDFNVMDAKIDTVQCIGPQTFTINDGRPTPTLQRFEAAEFKNEFPQLKNASKEKIEKTLKDSQWQKIEISSKCALALRTKNEGVVAYLVTWGSGKGFVFKGSDTSRTSQAMQEAITTLNHGACSWK